jgi:hypothetical protein
MNSGNGKVNKPLWRSGVFGKRAFPASGMLDDLAVKFRLGADKRLIFAAGGKYSGADSICPSPRQVAKRAEDPSATGATGVLIDD